ncbi:hypothetical protein K438DRAFT_1796262 [Mycena galopus ATCC 62051]|nr:hypothetical protein K438DRAFT_1796262 [Mycena galopus ATCC 62051]
MLLNSPAAEPSLCTHGLPTDKCISGDHQKVRCDDATQTALPPQTPPGLSLPSPRQIQMQNQRMALRVWFFQKHHNPYLPLVLSHFNPLRALLPVPDWKSTSTAHKPFRKAGWNFKRPLPSRNRPIALRNRKECDAEGEHLPLEAVLTGGLRSHCAACNKDPLHKRLLLVRHWASTADAAFKAALARMHLEDAALENDCPQTVFPRDLDDFDDEVDDAYDDWSMETAPLIMVSHPGTKSYPLRLF